MRTRTWAKVAAGIAVLAVAVWWRVTHDPNEQDLLNRFSSPSLAAPFGTDGFGRDMLSRIVDGAVITIGAASTALAVTAVIGTTLGLFAAWRGGRTGSALLVVTDSLVAVPEVVVALIAVSIFGTNLGALMIAVIVVGWLPFARLSFELASRVLGSDYAMAAQMTGTSSVRIVRFTLLPNVLRPLISLTFLRFPGRLLLLSGLSFLGLGPQPPTPEWGAMLADGVEELERHPFVPLVPGLAIVLTGFAAAHLGRRLEAPATGPTN
mgnify:CR=1 FL=1